MNFKRQKPNRKKINRPYNVVWSYKKSFKRDYLDKKEFKKLRVREMVSRLAHNQEMLVRFKHPLQT